MKAIRVKDAASVRGVEPFHTDFHLLDAYVPGTRGGTGETFAWDLVRHHPGSVPVVLSGGLTPDNVAESIAAVRPYAVDSASGTEASPGRKDPAKLEALFRAVAAVDEREPAEA
jgi:phosphoribosylanthranilate isomerase